MPTLNFRGRSFIERHHENLPHHTLVPDPDLSVLPEGENPSLSGNLLIEGDNLLALESLLPHFRGKIKCVYIDPPYNTGNENWVYNDNVSGALFKEWLGQEVGKQGEDFNRHDKWCCMMYPRLMLLRELLREDGVIFVSIDDNEVHHLRMLMDEIFGEENLIGELIWKRRQNVDSRTKTGLSIDHEYVSVFAKNSGIALRGQDKDLTKYTNPNDDPRGAWASDNLVGLASKEQRPNLHYDLVNPETGIVYECPPTGWRYSRDTMSRLISVGQIIWPPMPTGRPRFRRYLNELESEFTGLSSVLNTVYTMQGTRELNEIFEGRDVLDFPKPMELIKLLVRQGAGDIDADGDIILDSFAGSGTTAHAVLQLNKDDGGNRRFITIQLPHDSKADENADRNIARDITRERIKRVIEGVGTKVPALGGSFTYARLSEEPLRGYYGVLRPGTTWEQLAGYVWQTETLTAFDPAKANRETGLLGRINNGDTAIYLLYSETEESRSLELATLQMLETEPAHTITVYAEKLWLDPDDRKEWIQTHKKNIRERLLPTQLR